MNRLTFSAVFVVVTPFCSVGFIETRSGFRRGEVPWWFFAAMARRNDSIGVEWWRTISNVVWCAGSMLTGRSVSLSSFSSSSGIVASWNVLAGLSVKTFITHRPTGDSVRCFLASGSNGQLSSESSIELFRFSRTIGPLRSTLRVGNEELQMKLYFCRTGGRRNGFFNSGDWSPEVGRTAGQELVSTNSGSRESSGETFFVIPEIGGHSCPWRRRRFVNQLRGTHEWVRRRVDGWTGEVKRLQYCGSSSTSTICSTKSLDCGTLISSP